MARYRVIVSSRADKFINELNERLRNRIIEEITAKENEQLFNSNAFSNTKSRC